MSLLPLNLVKGIMKLTSQRQMSMGLITITNGNRRWSKQLLICSVPRMLLHTLAIQPITEKRVVYVHLPFQQCTFFVVEDGSNCKSSFCIQGSYQEGACHYIQHTQGETFLMVSWALYERSFHCYWLKLVKLYNIRAELYSLFEESRERNSLSYN